MFSAFRAAVVFFVLRLIVRKSAGGCGLCRYGGRVAGRGCGFALGALVVVGFGLVCAGFR